MPSVYFKKKGSKGKYKKNQYYTKKMKGSGLKARDFKKMKRSKKYRFLITPY